MGGNGANIVDLTDAMLRSIALVLLQNAIKV